MASSFNCPSCSAPLDFIPSSSSTIRCPYCHNSVIVPEELRGEPSSSASDNTRQNPILQAELKDKLDFVREAAMSGNKLVAVRALRDSFPLGLKQATKLVDAMQQGKQIDLQVLQSLYSPPIQTVTLDPSTMQQITDLVRSGDKINAIKLFRQATGVGLKQAQEAIDGMLVAMSASMDNSSYEATLSPSPPIIPATTSQSSGTLKMGGGIILSTFILFIVLVTVVPILIAMASRGGPLADTWARINPFAAGRLTLSFGREGTGPGYFSDAEYVAVDNDGHIFVGELSGGRIQVFDDNGKYLTQWQARGDQPGDIYLTGMASGRDEAVYTVVGSQLYVYDGMTGNLLGQLDHPDGWGFDDVTVAPDGSIVAAWYKNRDDIIRFNRNGETTLLVKSAISSVTQDSELDMQVAVDGTGNIYVLAYFNEGVFIFSADGRYTSRFGSMGDDKGQFTSPRSIAIDNLGRIYIADFPGVMIYASDGRYLDTLPVNGAVKSMAFDDQNNLYLVADEQVLRYQLR
jgi:ribosomal protein L7/L12/sugar lactone lactonase YvrE/DNA-directed RNA polymerase subunit RPC12/RpoP